MPLSTGCLTSLAPKPSSGPHKARECLPLILILRNKLKYTLTYREVISILMQRHVLVDARVRTDKTYPAGFMDVSIPKTNENAFCMIPKADSAYTRSEMKRQSSSSVSCDVCSLARRIYPTSTLVMDALSAILI